MRKYIYVMAICLLQYVYSNAGDVDTISKEYLQSRISVDWPILIRPSRFADLKFPYFPGFRTYPEDYSNGLVSQGDDYIAYEVDMTDYALSTFVTKENAEAFAATNDSLYVKNIVKFVRYYPKGNARGVRSFFVTYIPDYSIVGRLEDYRRMTFANVEASFSGIVLVHETYGNFLYGDIYKNGVRVNALINGRDGNRLYLKRQLKKFAEKQDVINELPYIVEESARSRDVVIKWKGGMIANLDLRHPVYYVTDILTDAKRAYNRSVVNGFLNEVFTKEQQRLYWSLPKRERNSSGYIEMHSKSDGMVCMVSIRLPKRVYYSMSNVQIALLWHYACHLKNPYKLVGFPVDESKIYVTVCYLFDRGSEDDNISDSEIEGALPVIVPVK